MGAKTLGSGDAVAAAIGNRVVMSIGIPIHDGHRGADSATGRFETALPAGPPT